MNCAFCQTEIPAGARFCPACGAPVTSATRAAPATPPPPRPTLPATPAQAGRKGRPLWLFGCLGVGALLVLCIVGWVVIRGIAGNGTNGGLAAATVAAPGTAGLTPAAKATARPAAGSAAKEPTVTLRPPLPDALKPLILAGPMPAADLRYEVTLNGDWSYAELFYVLKGEDVHLESSNAALSGTNQWSVRFVFRLSEDSAQGNLQSQLKSMRDAGDPNSPFVGAKESRLAKVDEGYLFSKPDADVPRYTERWYALRQGKTFVFVTSFGDVESPVVPGDGIDLLAEALKKVDNAALIAAAKP